MDAQIPGTTNTSEDGLFGSTTSVATMSEESHNPIDRADFKAALEDLDGVIDEAREDGYPEPTPQAIENARLLVKTMYDIRPMRYDIYPMDDGEVVIDGGGERRIGVFCYSDGSVLYIGWVGDERVRIHRDSPDDIPYEFLNLALHQLGDA